MQMEMEKLGDGHYLSKCGLYSILDLKIHTDFGDCTYRYKWHVFKKDLSAGIVRYLAVRTLRIAKEIVYYDWSKREKETKCDKCGDMIVFSNKYQCDVIAVEVEEDDEIGNDISKTLSVLYKRTAVKHLTVNGVCYHEKIS